MIDSVEIIRVFTEFTLRSFTSFRMTLRGIYPEQSEWTQGDKNEEFRMTDTPISLLRHSLQGKRGYDF
jgi:hypothetical protein